MRRISKPPFYYDHESCKTFNKALTYFQEAVAKDPKFAPAYAGMADTLFELLDWRCGKPATFEQAEAAASKALELDPSNAEAHDTLGGIAFSRDWNWKKAAAEFNKALQ